MAKVVLICLLLAGCGTFPLAANVTAPANKTTAGMRLDILDCKDRARLYADSAEKQARAFALALDFWTERDGS